MSRPTISSMALAAALLAAGCADTTEIDNKPAATVAEPAKEAAAPAADAAPAKEAAAPAGGAMVADPEAATAPEGDVWTATPETSEIGFLGAKVTATHDGGFKDFSGTAVSKDGKIVWTKFVAQASSIWADAGAMSDKLTGHLKSDDFFDVEKNPVAAFASTNIAYGEGDSATVTGNLKFAGVTKEITFPATIKTEGDAVKATADFKINRTDWGLTYTGKADDLIKEEVAIDLDLTFTK